MLNLSFKKQQNRLDPTKDNQTHFPLQMLTIMSLLSLCGLVMIAWSMNRQGSELVENEKQYGEIILLKSEILHLDEVLTMSCLVATLTGNITWVQRYKKFEPILDKKIKRLMNLVPPHLHKTVIQTQKANLDLVRLEMQAFAAVEKQELTRAISYLEQDSYQQLKTEYNQGMVSLTGDIKDFLNQKLQASNLFYDRLELLATLVIIFLTTAWIIVLKSVFRWKQEILHAYQEVDHAEKRLQTTLQMTQIGVFTASSPYKMLQVSPRAAQLFKVEKNKEMPYRDLFQHLDESDYKHLISQIQHTQTHQLSQLTHCECQVIKNDSIEWLSIHWSVEKIYQRPMLFGWVQNITRSKKKTTSLQHHNKILQENVEKHIQTSKNQKNQIEMLLHSLLRAEKQERSRLARLVHDDLQQILVAARMQAAMARDITPIEPNTISNLIICIDEAITSARDLTTRLSSLELDDQSLIRMLKKLSKKMKQRYSLKIFIDNNIEHLILKPEIILLSYQMIHELLFNIVKHAQTNLAYVTLKRVKQDLHLQVKDEGIGFDPNWLQQGLIHEQLDTGLGLSSMQNRLNMIGGHINVDSTNKQGCTISIYLPNVFVISQSYPISDEFNVASDLVRLDQIDTPSHRIYTVLIADDNLPLSQSLQTLINQSESFKVIAQSRNGIDTINQALIHQPDLILMDYSMPICSGAEACQRIKDTHPHVQIIGISSFDTPQVTHEMLQAGAVMVLTKDGEPQELLSKMLLVCENFIKSE